MIPSPSPQRRVETRPYGYDYAAERDALFTDEGQRIFLKIRDRAKRLLKEAGAFRMSEVIAGSTGSNWTMLACVDRLVELGEIVELRREAWGQYRREAWGQYRVFTTGEVRGY